MISFSFISFPVLFLYIDNHTVVVHGAAVAVVFAAAYLRKVSPLHGDGSSWRLCEIFMTLPRYWQYNLERPSLLRALCNLPPFSHVRACVCVRCKNLAADLEDCLIEPGHPWIASSPFPSPFSPEATQAKTVENLASSWGRGRVATHVGPRTRIPAAANTRKRRKMRN